MQPTTGSTRCWCNVDLKLGQRRRQCANFNPTSVQHLVLAGTWHIWILITLSVRGPSLYVRIWRLYRRHILTSKEGKDGPRWSLGLKKKIFQHFKGYIIAYTQCQESENYLAHRGNGKRCVWERAVLIVDHIKLIRQYLHRDDPSSASSASKNIT